MTTTTTVTSAYDDPTTADRAIAALRQEGFEDRQVRILSGDATALVGERTGHGFEEGDARAYAKAADGGRTLVVASAAEEGPSGRCRSWTASRRTRAGAAPAPCRSSRRRSR